jgi:hypothetical protein
MASDGAASRRPPLAPPPKRRAAGDLLQTDLLTYKRRRRATSTKPTGGSPVASGPDQVRIPLLALAGSSFLPQLLLSFRLPLLPRFGRDAFSSACQDFVSALCRKISFPRFPFHVAILGLGLACQAVLCPPLASMACASQDLSAFFLRRIRRPWCPTLPIVSKVPTGRSPGTGEAGGTRWRASCNPLL